MSVDGPDLEVRPFDPVDERRVLELLGASLGGGPAGNRPPGFFRWKHLENPFGESLMLLAEAQERIIGFRAFMRWRFATGEREVTAVRAVDTATHPDFQGRGIFSKLTQAALDQLRGRADLVFNTPNGKSLPGYLKMGWRVVGSVPIRVRVRRPFRFLRSARSWRGIPSAGVGPPVPTHVSPASEALGDAEGLSLLLKRSGSLAGRLATPRTVEFLRWRYGSVPLLDYRAIREDDGLAIFRVRPRGRLVEATLAELIVEDGDEAAARRLLSSVARSAGVDHVTMTFPAGSTADRASRHGTLRAPGGMTLVANVLVADPAPDPTVLSSWALSLGDLEVF